VLNSCTVEVVEDLVWARVVGAGIFGETLGDTLGGAGIEGGYERVD
jgi:hypothetical protein